MKANLSLGFLRRNLSSCPEGVKEAAHKAIVRPYLEYASSVWDPHLKKHVKQIEGVQRRAARFVKNCYTREPGTVTNLLNELNWIPLKVRRTISRLTLFHKAIHGDGGLAFPDYVMKRRTLAKTSLLNSCQILRLIRIVIFVELSSTGMRYQAKLLTLNPQIVSKKSY